MKRRTEETCTFKNQKFDKIVWSNVNASVSAKFINSRCT